MSLFDIELSHIQNGYFRGIVAELLKYFEPLIKDAPASRPGNHPEGEELPGGLILHCKRVAWVCIEICNEFNIVGEMHDAMLGAAILHDIGRAIPYLRPGDEKPEMHKKLHGPKSCQFIIEQLSKDLNCKELNVMYDLIDSHMSHWDERAPQPITNEQHLFALADYIATKKILKVPILEK